MSKYGFRADFDPNNKVVKQEKIQYLGNAYDVSTVDLGLDHSFGAGAPLYYETMIFPHGQWDEMYCRRYSTREIALRSHEQLVKNIAEGRYAIEDGYFELSEEPT